jgi:hypothetical protein
VRRGAARLGPILTVVGALAAPAGCLLPWETVTVDAGGPGGVTHLDALHGAGVLACVGACGALVALALRLAGPDSSRARDALETLAGGLLVLGAALFVVAGGYRPGSGPGWSVAIAPGLVVAGTAGVVLLAAQAVSVIAAAGSDEATCLR